MGNSKGLAILALLLGASGLGLGAYSISVIQIVNLAGIDGTDGIDGINGTDGRSNHIVCLWENLSGGPAKDFTIHGKDLQINNSNYFYTDASNESFYLIQEGWYRVLLITQLVQLNSSHSYSIFAEKNGVGYISVDYIYMPTSNSYDINCMFYISSNGMDYFTIRCLRGNEPHIPVECRLSEFAATHQLVIEYVGDY